MLYFRSYAKNDEDFLAAAVKNTSLVPQWLTVMYMLTDPYFQNLCGALGFIGLTIFTAVVFGLISSILLFIVGVVPMYFWMANNKSGTCLPNGWKFGPKNVSGKNVMITGANCGMGLAAAEQILRWNAKSIYIACRDAVKGQKALSKLEAIKEQNGLSTELHLMSLDLSDLASVKECADKMNAAVSESGGLHLLMNNAGVMMCPFSTTKNGFELQWGTNHLGHFYLTKLLLPSIQKAGTEESPSRIVVYASLGHNFVALMNYMGQKFSASMIPSYIKTISPDTYNLVYAYGFSKASNVLFASALQKKLAGSNVKVYSVHPGGVNTDLDRHVMGIATIIPFAPTLLVKTPLEGASTALYCATAPTSILTGGAYYSDCTQLGVSAAVSDIAAENSLWEVSEQCLKKAGFE